MREEGAGAGNAVGVGMYMGTGNLAINNVVYNIQGPGILAEYGCTQCGIYNNTSYGNTGQYGSGIGVGPYASGTVVKNNIAWGNQLRDIDQVGSDTTLANNLCATGPCTITQNPRFVDAAGKNFRLLPGSPAFNAGIDLASIVKNDILGTPRPQDGAFDLGAYECTCGSGDTTPPAIPRNVRVQ
jgi:hypothetical protein